MKQLQEAELEHELAAVLDAAERGERTVVTRDGKPVAVVAPFTEPASRRELPKPREPGGLLAAKGLLADWETMEEDMAEVIAMRRQAVDRPPLDFE